MLPLYYLLVAAFLAGVCDGTGSEGTAMPSPSYVREDLAMQLKPASVVASCAVFCYLWMLFASNVVRLGSTVAAGAGFCERERRVHCLTQAQTIVFCLLVRVRAICLRMVLVPFAF